MYCISNEQIDFILDDISARGIKIDSLQQNLLDHVCCIIEHNLEDSGDFESFYLATISGFYITELKEIEEEAITLLINKNYYVMKKVMIYSGVFSIATLAGGIVFKFLRMPGAAILILSGIMLISFVFLPLLLTLKLKEKQEGWQRAIVGLGVMSGIVMSTGILFKLMHWPGATLLCTLALGIVIFLFLPVYFFSGIRKPETKVNTIVSSILLLAGCAMIFALVKLPPTANQIDNNSNQVTTTKLSVNSSNTK